MGRSLKQNAFTLDTAENATKLQPKCCIYSDFPSAASPQVVTYGQLVQSLNVSTGANSQPNGPFLIPKSKAGVLSTLACHSLIHLILARAKSLQSAPLHIAPALTNPVLSGTAKSRAKGDRASRWGPSQWPWPNVANHVPLRLIGRLIMPWSWSHFGSTQTETRANIVTQQRKTRIQICNKHI